MPDPSKITRVIFAVTNCICYDQRVMKIAGTVSNMGCEVTIAGRRKGECCKLGLVPFKTKRFVMIFKKGFLFYSFFNIRLFFYLLSNNYNLLVSNDLDTLLPCFLVSKLKNVPLVYDSHEYFTGVPEIQNRPLVKWVWKSIEKIIFPQLKYVMTVSDSIALRYEKVYGIKPLTIRNCAVKAKGIPPFSHEELNIPAGHLVLILQGTGINRDRGGEELIDALSQIENVSLIIVGSGDLLHLLKEKVAGMRLDSRIQFYPKCSWETLMRYTKSADAGLSLDKNTNINHEFSLPNKLFDYIGAGLPVVSSDLSEIRKILTEYKCGILIPEVTPEEIIKAIVKLRDDRNMLAELKYNASVASESLNWNKESVKVEKLYNSILVK